MIDSEEKKDQRGTIRVPQELVTRFHDIADSERRRTGKRPALYELVERAVGILEERTKVRAVGEETLTSNYFRQGIPEYTDPCDTLYAQVKERGNSRVLYALLIALAALGDESRDTYDATEDIRQADRRIESLRNRLSEIGIDPTPGRVERDKNVG